MNRASTGTTMKPIMLASAFRLSILETHTGVTNIPPSPNSHLIIYMPMVSSSSNMLTSHATSVFYNPT